MFLPVDTFLLKRTKQKGIYTRGIILKKHIVKRLPGERYTPFGLARKLNARIILESSSLTKGKERFSILLVREVFTIEQREGEVYLKEPAGKVKRIRQKGRDILDVIRFFTDKHGNHNHDFPYPAGGVGFLSFEFSKYCDDIAMESRKDPLDLPEAAFIFGSTFIIFDHYTDEIIILLLNYPGYEIDLDAELAGIEEKITDLNFNYMMEKTDETKATLITGPDKDEEYREAVRIIREEIIKGNLLQAVPSRRLEIETEKTAPGCLSVSP